MSFSLRRCALRLLKTSSECRSLTCIREKSTIIENSWTKATKITGSYVGTQTERKIHNKAQASWATTRDESREMMALWPDVIRDITEFNRELDIPEVSRWYTKVLQYNVPIGKKHRALALVGAYKMLVPPEDLTEENLRLARILGWCIEIIHGYFILADDIMDRAETRRGQKCWYLCNNMGLAAINDGMYLGESVHQLLKKYFKDKPYYLDIIDTIADNKLRTLIGQSLDMMATQFNSKPNFEKFTMDRYNAITRYKTGYYTFVMPVTLAMYLAGITDAEVHRQAKTILLEMGHFYQVQDDYLDCYGDPRVTGKDDRDIQEGKCTWLAVVALQRATPAQRKILEESYGKEDAINVARVKHLYDDLALSTTYSIYEEETYNLLNTHIQQISRGLPHDMFFKFLSKIYRRDT